MKVCGVDEFFVYGVFVVGIVLGSFLNALFRKKENLVWVALKIIFVSNLHG